MPSPIGPLENNVINVNPLLRISRQWELASFWLAAMHCTIGLESSSSCTTMSTGLRSGLTSFAIARTTLSQLASLNTSYHGVTGGRRIRDTCRRVELRLTVAESIMFVRVRACVVSRVPTLVLPSRAEYRMETDTLVSWTRGGTRGDRSCPVGSCARRREG